MLVDQIELTLIAGKGGDGAVTRFAGQRRRPSGGNGGYGGSVYVRGIQDLAALNRYAGIRVLKADDGGRGGSNRKTGAKGKDLIVDIPVGTKVTDLENGNFWEITEIGEQYLVCKGGNYGRGNAELKGDKREIGKPGQERKVELNLRLIADIGLVGLPNAGKSSLLNFVTNAKAEIGGYAFTTLEPNLGVMERQVIADIPGLIEGAAEGKGLGYKFLKHIEKVSTLLHCISAESVNLEYDYKVIRSELKQFSPIMLEKPEVIVLTKTDLLDEKEIKKRVKELQKFNKQVISLSTVQGDKQKVKEEILGVIKNYIEVGK